VASIARLIRVSTFEFEAGDTVIKPSLFPVHWRMAITARRVTERVAVGIFITVAIDATSIDGFVQTVGMTIGTVNTTMFPFQGKDAHAVVVKYKMSTCPTGF